jgi:hypothetical protein
MPDIAALGDVGQKIVASSLLLIDREDGLRSQDVNLYLKRDTFPAGGRLAIAHVSRELPTQQKSLYVFADLAPLANWGHPARHLFFNPRTGGLMHAESSLFPPRDFEANPESFQPVHVPKVHMAPVTSPFFLTHMVARTARRTRKAGRRHAILFSGNSNNRHLNDLEFFFRVLCDIYEYKPDDIYVLNYDGSLNYSGPPQPVAKWPGDGTPYRLTARIVGAGPQADFDKVFGTVARKLRSADTLLIHTNNHGGDASTYGEVWLCGYPNFTLVYKASVFGQRLASLPKCRSLIVGMEQCYSGGFMGPTLTNSKATDTSFASAVPANMSSMGGPDFDPWAFDWIAAFNGCYPGGTPLKQPVVARPPTKAAFDYSSAVHVPGDAPVFQDAPAGIGATQHLD